MTYRARNCARTRKTAKCCTGNCRQGRDCPSRAPIPPAALLLMLAGWAPTAIEWLVLWLISVAIYSGGIVPFSLS